MKRMVSLFMLAIVLALLNSCLFLWEDPGDPVLKKQRDSYMTLIEFHAYKQVLMYEYIGLFSDNFTNTKLFEYEPTSEELAGFFQKIEQLLEYEEEIINATESLDSMQFSIKNSNDLMLKSAMAKWDWLLKYVPFKGKNIELRNKISKNVKNLTAEQRDELFNLLADTPAWQGGALNANEFFNKIEKGELDNSILSIHKTFQDFDSEYFMWADQNKLKSSNLAYEYGKEGLETGEKVLVNTVKNLNPAIGTSITILDYGNKFLNYMNNSITGKTVEEYKNQIKEQVEKKFPETGLSQNASPEEMATSIVKSTEILSKIAQVNNNPNSIISSDFGWGGVKLSNIDNSLLPEIVFAERLYDDIAPNVVLCTEMFIDELNQWVIGLPEGEWDIVAINKKGEADSILDWSVITKNFGVVEISSKTIIDSTNTEEDVDPVDTDIDFPQYSYVLIGCVSTCGSIFFTNDHKEQENNLSLTWSGNNFSVTYDYKRFSENTHNYAGSISGSISKNADGVLVVSLVGNETESWPWGGFYEQKKQVSFNQIPIHPSQANSFNLDATNTPDMIANIGSYVSYSFVGTYSLNGEVVQDDPATTSCSNNFNDAPSVYVAFRY